MTVTYHRDLEQGSDAWLAARRGLLTASEMSRIMTPGGKAATNAAERAHVYEIAAQRISKFVDPSYDGDNIMRGYEDEIDARYAYGEWYAPVEEVGFITNDRWGFTIGYSPDGLVGDDGLIEIKSRKQRFQIETGAKMAIPTEHVVQVQTALLVSERAWCDFISYSAGLHFIPIRAVAVPEIQEAIVEAATAFEARVAEVIDAYQTAAELNGWRMTERRLEREIHL